MHYRYFRKQHAKRFSTLHDPFHCDNLNTIRLVVTGLNEGISE